MPPIHLNASTTIGQERGEAPTIVHKLTLTSETTLTRIIDTNHDGVTIDVDTIKLRTFKGHLTHLTATGIARHHGKSTRVRTTQNLPVDPSVATQATTTQKQSITDLMDTIDQYVTYNWRTTTVPRLKD